MKNHRYQYNKYKTPLKDLTHEQKVKRLYDITRVPLSNLQTNIVESDLQEQDIQTPITMKLTPNTNETQCIQNKLIKNACKQSKKKEESKKSNDELNQIIKNMTQQLYTLTLQNEKLNNNIESSQISKKVEQQYETKGINLADNISFNLKSKQLKSQQRNYNQQDFILKTTNSSKKQRKTIEINTERHPTDQNSTNEKDINKNKNDQRGNSVDMSKALSMTFIPTKHINSSSNLYRQSQPLRELFTSRQNKTIVHQNMKRKECFYEQSSVSKRFGRNKQYSEHAPSQNTERKAKFNRSNHKEKKINRQLYSDKQNHCPTDHFIGVKKLKIERKSVQQVQISLKKRKNVWKNFMSVAQQSNIREQSQNRKNIQNNTTSNKQTSNTDCNAKCLDSIVKVESILNKYQQLQHHYLFDKYEKKNMHKGDQEYQFSLIIFQQYKQAIEVLKANRETFRFN